MSEAQLMEEELQQSVRVAESLDADGDQDMPDVHLTGVSHENGEQSDGDEVDDEDIEDNEEDEEEGDDADSEDGSENGSMEEDAEHEDYDQDAEHEEEDALIPSRGIRTRSRGHVNHEEEYEEDGEDEAVGAVKLKPGETDEEESDAASFHTGGESDGDVSESEDEWEALQPEKENGDEDESELGDNDVCMFCKQDENHDPAEEFEAYLSCASCGENSHQQCAREANALESPVEDPTQWRCPDCAAVDDETQRFDMQEENGRDEDEAEQENNGNASKFSPSSSRSGRNSLRESVQKVARELLPAQRGAKPNSHSIYNQLVLDDDPMDGSRNLRKRKASTTEPEEHIMSLRKRRKSTIDTQSNEGTNGIVEGVGPRTSRPVRLKLTPQASAEIIKSTRSSMVVRFTAKPAALRKIFSHKPQGVKKRRGRRAGAGGRRGNSARGRRGAAAGDVPVLPPLTAPFVSTSYSQPFYSFYDKEADEFRGKPYGGVLTEAEADTSRTLPTSEDRRRFDEAKQQAEEAWRERLLTMQAEAEVPVRKPAKKVSGPASQIECIEFGGWEIDTWYAAPYPEEYSRNRVLYICEFCLKYMNSDYVAWRHKLKCPAKHPPGDEIYRHGSVSVFEVDGRKNPVYCQNLCLLAKLFLGSKTLYYDVEPFLFYILCEYDELGYHFVGYFSKEKRESSQNNVSCILTLPIHQRKGYGNLLIDFSYLLTRVEQKTGSPEKPLSDMGLVSYRSYWRLIICRYFLQHISTDKSQTRGLSIKHISEDTGLTADDVVSALEALRFFVRDPRTGLYALRVDFEYCREYVAKWESKNYVQLKPSALTWTPYVMGRSYPSNFELGPAINVLAPREEDDNQQLAVVVETTEDTVIASAHDNVDSLDDGARQEPDAAAGVTVLESTEPNEGASVLVTDLTGPADPAPADATQLNGVNHGVNHVEVNQISEGRNCATTTPTDDATTNGSGDWISAYKDIPPTRFEVFPPATNARLARARSTVTRAPAVRIAGSARRPAGRRRTSGIKRSAGPKPRSATKRKTGGTGRGPGRWPKGTKKSDYGNADSGPGLPPGWIEKKAASVATASPGASVKRRGVSKNGSQPSPGEEEDGGGTVEVLTPNRATAGSAKGRPTPRSARGKNGDDTIELVQGDVKLTEGEDEDA